MKNIILLSLETCLFVIMVYCAVVNYQSKTIANFAVSLNGEQVVISVFLVIVLFYIVGLLSGLVYSKVLTGTYKNQLAQYAKRNEKLALKSETDSDDKEVLKRKIASLEIALDNALNNKS